MNDQNKPEDKKGGVNPAVAAVAGAVVGAAAVGVAAVAVLANNKSRKQAEDAIDAAKGKVEDVKENVEEKIGEGKAKVEKVITAVKDASKDVVKAAQ